MFILISTKKLKKLLDKARDEVWKEVAPKIHKAYELGYQLGKTEKSNRGFIIGQVSGTKIPKAYLEAFEEEEK